MTEAQLKPHKDRAVGFLKSVRWTPKPSVVTSPSKPGGALTFREAAPTASEEEGSILEIAYAVSGNKFIMLPDINHAVNIVMRGMQIGMHLSGLYTGTSGLDRLAAQNRVGGLDGPQKAEFRAKFHTASAIATFVAAYYVCYELSRFRVEELGNVQIDPPQAVELAFENPIKAMQCMIFYYAAYLEPRRSVANDLEFVKMAQIYFQKVLDEIKMRQASFEHVSFFDSQQYKLEVNDFSVHGFEVEIHGAEIGVEFKRVELSEIVGNRAAKHGARRIVERLLCYDPETQRNPFVELGSFPNVRLGYGKPGTGKSLQIALTGSMLHDHCKALELPFLFWPMPDNIVSTFQGGSAERMLDWMRPLSDPTKIVYGPIDDAENNFEDRTRQGVSAGVREVIGVFLRHTEGASAINRGCSVIDIFTNLPDQIDPAILSRVVSRFAVDGAEKREDFLDQDYLWWRRFTDIDPRFVDMIDPRDYAYLAAQAQLKSLSDVYDGPTEATEEPIQKILEAVRTRHHVREHDFFAALYKETLAAFPSFASRDIRNIQSAVSSRVMDFDLPDDWFEDHESFFTKDYETKKGMLIELMRSNMRGLSFADIRLQEAVRYLDNMVRIAEVTRRKRMDQLVEEQLMHLEVMNRVKTRLEGS